MTEFQRLGGRSQEQSDTRPKLLAAGSLLGAIGASSCCILPLVLFGLGITGAWIGGLTALTPYQPIFVVITLGFLGTGFYLVYRKPKAVDCQPGAYCASPKSERVIKAALWGSTILVVAAMLFPYVAPLLLES
jgi:mercuric ion transport protein